MDVTDRGENEQIALWNGAAGRTWVDSQELVDNAFRPLEERLAEAVAAGSGTRVLDVGCGSGGTTLAVARSLGTAGRCVGIDVSEPMVAAARARAEREGLPVRFIHADAQRYDFEPASFDTIVSRFGVMFFDDAVRAFANLRRAATDDARLCLIAWRGPAENPFLTTAERAAAPLLPDMPARQLDAPGQFFFADGRRVHRILEESGWSAIDIRPLDVTCAFPEKALVGYFTRFGPLARVFPDLDEATRARVVEKVRPVFERFVQGDQVRFTAACWMIGARAGTRAG